MSWQTALQTFSAGLAALAIYFLYDLIREFKLFKKETGVDISNLKIERSQFQTTVRNAELTIGLRVEEMHKIHTTFSHQVQEKILGVREELIKTKFAADTIVRQSERLEEYLKKSFQLSKALNESLKRHEKEIQMIKIKIGDTTIFK